MDGEEPVGVGADRPDDAHAALEECRLAVEQVVLPQGRPVELLPRNEAVRALQAELVHHYRLRSAVFGRGRQQRLRVFSRLRGACRQGGRGRVDEGPAAVGN